MALGQRVRVIVGEIVGDVVAVEGNRIRVSFPVGLKVWYQADELEVV